MSMNRETKRLLKKQGQMDDEGNPVATRRAAPVQRTKAERVPPAQFAKEVRGELRKVAWPTRNEVVNYAIIVLATIIILTTIIGIFDYGFGKAVIALFDR